MRTTKLLIVPQSGQLLLDLVPGVARADVGRRQLVLLLHESLSLLAIGVLHPFVGIRDFLGRKEGNSRKYKGNVESLTVPW